MIGDYQKNPTTARLAMSIMWESILADHNDVSVLRKQRKSATTAYTIDYGHHEETTKAEGE